MPTRLLPGHIRALGRFGYYAEADTTYDDPRYAASFSNGAFDKLGRPTARKGWATALTTPISGTPNVHNVHFLRQAIGGTDVWVAAADDDKIYKLTGTIGSGSSTDITGTITAPTSYTWQFVSYNDKIAAIQQGDGPIVWDGSATPFADMDASGVNEPKGNALCSAWGRLFCSTEDGQGINWTGLLGEDFDGAGSGQLNVRLVWPNGADRIVAIVAFAKRLVIFGEKNVLIYGDKTQSQLSAGVNPNSTEFGILESIENIGLVCRDGWTKVGDDLFFISRDGVRNLRRAVEYDNLPMQVLTRNIDPAIQDAFDNYGTSECTMEYYQPAGMILLKVGSSRFYLDVRVPINTENSEFESSILRASVWTGIPWNHVHAGIDENLIFSFDDGVLGYYTGYRDNEVPYQLDLSSVWLDLGDNTPDSARDKIKILKRLSLFCSTQETQSVTFRWAWDFSTTFTFQTVAVMQASSPAEWGTAEWALGGWAGDADSVFQGSAQGTGSGTYLKIGFSVPIDGEGFSFNSIMTQTKTGRLTR